jgi:hypothetical protein
MEEERAEGDRGDCYEEDDREYTEEEDQSDRFADEMEDFWA